MGIRINPNTATTDIRNPYELQRSAGRNRQPNPKLVMHMIRNVSTYLWYLSSKSPQINDPAIPQIIITKPHPKVYPGPQPNPLKIGSNRLPIVV